MLSQQLLCRTGGPSRHIRRRRAIYDLYREWLGSAHADSSNPPSELELSAESGGFIQFTVTGEPTDVPISVSMTAIDCVGVATLKRDGDLIGEITADDTGQHGSFPPGPLSPGVYEIQLLFHVLVGQTSEEVDLNFNFFGTFTVGGTVPTNEIEWNNFAGGAFHAATNWDPQMVPGAGDTAVFGLESAYSVDVGAATTERLELRSGDVTFTNANYTVSSTVFDPAGILLDNAKLTLASVSVLSGVHALIGESAAARVDVITGGLSLSGSLRVGGPGNGILDIEDGGIVLSGEGRIGNGVGGGTVRAERCHLRLGQRKSGGRLQRKWNAHNQRWRYRE